MYSQNESPAWTRPLRNCIVRLSILERREGGSLAPGFWSGLGSPQLPPHAQHLINAPCGVQRRCSEVINLLLFLPSFLLYGSKRKIETRPLIWKRCLVFLSKPLEWTAGQCQVWRMRRGPWAARCCQNGHCGEAWSGSSFPLPSAGNWKGAGHPPLELTVCHDWAWTTAVAQYLLCRKFSDSQPDPNLLRGRQVGWPALYPTQGWKQLVLIVEEGDVCKPQAALIKATQPGHRDWYPAW